MAIMQKSRVLIIDDNQYIHDDLTKILCPALKSDECDTLVEESTGHAESNRRQLDIRIDSALQGEEGLEMVRQARKEGNPYAITFVDMRISPGIDGLKTIKQLQMED